MSELVPCSLCRCRFLRSCLGPCWSTFAHHAEVVCPDAVPSTPKSRKYRLHKAISASRFTFGPSVSLSRTNFLMLPP